MFTLPELPTHDRLIAQEWVCAVAIENNQIEVTDNNILVGISYATKSGLTEFDYELNYGTGKTAYLNMDGTKNWGDGTTDTAYSHTYADYGKYTVTCDGTQVISTKASDYFGLTANPSGDGFDYTCVGIRVGNNVTRVGDITIAGNVRHITIPNSVTLLQSDMFEVCTVAKIATFVIANGVTTISGSIGGADHIIINNNVTTFTSGLSWNDETVLPNSVISLKNITLDGRKLRLPSSLQTIGDIKANYIDEIDLPSTLTSVGRLNLASVRSLTLPNSITAFVGIPETNYLIKEFAFPINMGSYNFNNNTFKLAGVEKIILPENATSITGTSTSLNRVKEIVYPKNIVSAHCPSTRSGIILHNFSKSITIPEFNSNLFTNPLNKVVVPDVLYDQWIATSGWSNYASQIFKASEVNL